jgi:phosphoribosyl-dephospho-CoA transferase
MNRQPLAHDILHLDVRDKAVVCDANLREVMDLLAGTPYAVVRRGRSDAGFLPIGVRGLKRNERYAAWIRDSAVQRLVSPEEIKDMSGARDLPAFEALRSLRDRWSDLKMPWGPTGSVGFEIVSGVPAVTRASDLDLLLDAEQWLSPALAGKLLADAACESVNVDIQARTPGGIISLVEYVASPVSLMLRQSDGEVRMGDPWQTEVCR